MTRDWITNEIFRRVEAKGRTMGEYLLEEVTSQGKVLEGADIYLGVPEDQLYRCYDLTIKGYFRSLDNHFLTESLGRDSNFSFCGIIQFIVMLIYRSY